jgi:hypothetical protein
MPLSSFFATFFAEKKVGQVLKKKKNLIDSVLNDFELLKT